MGLYKYYNLYRNYGFEALKLNLRYKFSKEEIIQSKIAGLRYPILIRKGTSDIQVFKQIFRYNEYSYEYSFDPEVIVDLGANTGLSCLYFHKRFPAAKIIAVEPETDNYKTMIKNTRNYKNILPLNKAIWYKPCHVELKNIGRGEWGFIVEESEAQTNNSIEAISIEQLISQFSLRTIDILKVDIEGAEKDLFSYKYESWIGKVKLLIIEVHDNIRPGSAKSLFKALTHLDFVYEHKGENIYIKFI